MSDIDDFDTVLTPQKSLFNLGLKKVWGYKDLLFLFVRRDFVSIYKQTILGPLWFFIQPLLTTLTFVVIFSKLAGISTAGIPQVLFYMAGLTLWNYFADCINKTSNTFVVNQNIFGKVYFPRLIVPLSVILTNLLKMGIQFLLFLCFWIYYLIQGEVTPNLSILYFPLLIVIMAALGLGLGMIVSSMTTKYRDLTFLVGFGVQLFMYATPIVYPISIISKDSQWIAMLNPMASIVEVFRYGFCGGESVNVIWLLYSLGVSVTLLLIGTVVFNKVEKSFIDTV